MKDNPKENLNEKDWFKSYFVNYFWVGLFIMMISIVINAQYPTHGLCLDIIIKTFEGIGVSILVASIFTFASGTSDFMGMIRKLLQGIVVDRNFLGNIDAESKRHALAALIKPSDIERNIYANLQDYYDVFIKRTLDISKKCVRSGYNVRARVYLENGKVAVAQDVSYRLHPTQEGYDNIKIRFEDEGFQSSKCEYILLSAPDGSRKMTKVDELTWTDAEGGGKICEINVKEFGDGHSHLNIELRLIEFGFNHWIHIAWQSLQPTDGFTYSLRCEDKIFIKSCVTFMHGAEFHIDKNSDTELLITCHEWFNEGTGIAIVASCKELI